MEGNLTPKMESYCRARMRGLSQRQAYREAYPHAAKWKDNSVDSEAHKLEHKPEVSMRLKELEAEAAAEAIGDRSEIITANFKAMRKAADEVERAQSLETVPVAARTLAQTSKMLAEWVPDAPSELDERSFDYARHLGRDFVDMHRWIEERRYSEFLLPGGRGSLKTSAVCLEVVGGVASAKGRNAVFMRNQTNKLRVSIYAEVKRAASRLGISDEFTWTVSPMQAVHGPTGNVIYFFGADNVEPQDSQLKGFAPEQGYVAYLVFEEASQFPGYSYIRSMKQTVLRGSDLPTWTFLTWNPPRSAQAWSNVIVDEPKPGRVVVRSNYLDAPPEWLGESFLDEAEALRESDPVAYEHEYGGNPTGTGIEVFDRLVFREVSDAEIAGFDNLRCGQDFGWWPDPWACTLSEWQPGRMTLITFKEDGGNKLTPKQQAARLRKLLTWADVPGGKPTYHHIQVRSDDAEPSAISQQRDAGANARAAGKGGMREASYRFLQAVTWVIDPVRCPKLAKEARELQHEVVKSTGEVLESIPDGNDHWVDATRYATMAEARSRYAYRGATEAEE